MVKTTSIIQKIISGDKKSIESLFNMLSNKQDLLMRVLRITLCDDKYINVTKQLWRLIDENEDQLQLIKYELYCHVLKQEDFQKKTVRYICIKERHMKYNSLLVNCGCEEAINFIMKAYNMNENHIIDAIANSLYESQIPAIEKLFLMLNNKQKISALDKFMSNYLNEYPKELNLVKFMLKQKEVWGEEVLENETIKGLIFFNDIDKKLTRKNRKDKKFKI